MPSDPSPIPMIQTPIPTPKRVERIAICLPCQLVATNARFHGTVVNLSGGGLCVELEGDVSELDLEALQFVTVESIGTLKVDGRWRRGRRVGVMFIDQNAAREQNHGSMDTPT